MPGRRHPRSRALFDARLLSAAAVALVLFVVHATTWCSTSTGFMRSRRAASSAPASETYRDFEPTLAGRLSPCGLTVDIVRVAWGWPMCLVSVAGVVLALLDTGTIAASRCGSRCRSCRTTRASSTSCSTTTTASCCRSAWCCRCSAASRSTDSLTVNAASDVALGLRPAAAFACTLLYAATVDLVMLRDSRYTVEQWLSSHVDPGDVVGYVFPQQYYPRLESFNTSDDHVAERAATAASRCTTC